MISKTFIREANQNDFEFVINAVHEIVKICLNKENIPIIPNDLANSLWNSMIENPEEYKCFIAENEKKKIIGTTVISFHHSLNYLGPVCNLQDLFVSQDARGTGAGRLLLDQVQKEAEKRECVAIELLMPDPGTPLDKERNIFYQNMGYILAGMSRYKPLRSTIYK